jgi:hypothetical protein
MSNNTDGVATTIKSCTEDPTDKETGEPIQVPKSGEHTNMIADVEECPLCCSEMTVGDVRYPLYCPTVTCHYNFCLDCIQRFSIAASEGYQIASDGSNQLKVVVRCPMCRSKYQSEIPPANKYSSEIIIQSVLMIRTATLIEKLLAIPDCELNATDLSRKTHFVMETSMDELEDAFARLQVYQASLVSSSSTNDKNDQGMSLVSHICHDSLSMFDFARDFSHQFSPVHLLRLVPLDWKLHRSVLREKAVPIINGGNSTSTNGNYGKGNETYPNDNIRNADKHTSTIPWKDPTLFGGLEEFMSVSEHEFLSTMMISGQSEMIASAATILGGIMELSSRRRATTPPPGAINSQMSRSFDSQDRPRQQSQQQQQQRGHRRNGSTSSQQQPHNRKPFSNNTNASSQPVKLSTAMHEHMQRVRKRFPLPIHMPRCVSLPIYDPIPTKPKPLLEFSLDAITKEMSLQLRSINGYAGRVGLRKGDSVTHVDGNTVETFDEFVIAMQRQCNLMGGPTHSPEPNNSETPKVQIIVNATQDAAVALQERYHDMVKNNIRFHY